MSAEQIAWLREQVEVDLRLAEGAATFGWCRCHPGHDGWNWEFAAGADYVQDADTGHSLVTEAGSYVGDHMDDRIGQFIACWDPARAHANAVVWKSLLSEIESALADDAWDESAKHRLDTLCAPYAQRPGYRDEWRPA